MFMIVKIIIKKIVELDQEYTADCKNNLSDDYNRGKNDGWQLFMDRLLFKLTSEDEIEGDGFWIFERIIPTKSLRIKNTVELIDFLDNRKKDEIYIKIPLKTKG